jgi:hypothetical protein
MLRLLSMYTHSLFLEIKFFGFLPNDLSAGDYELLTPSDGI